MYDSLNPIQSRRLPVMKSRSSSGILKRHPSGHVPQLNANNPRPLANIINLPTKGKRSIDETVEYDVPTSNYASIRPQATSNPIKRTKTDPKKTNSLPTDGSLRVITSTVQGMKHWTNKHLPYPMLFEIFGRETRLFDRVCSASLLAGQLDSQVTSLSSSNTRQFSLIDEKDRLECLFAEIDQSFSHIDRDVQLR